MAGIVQGKGKMQGAPPLAHMLFQCSWKWGKLCVEVSPLQPIGDKFPWLFQNVALGNLIYFFQLDHQVHISFYVQRLLHDALLGMY